MPQEKTPYQPDALIRPGANLSVFVWLVLLGLPALLLLMIYSKLDSHQSKMPGREMPTVNQMQVPAEHP